MDEKKVGTIAHINTGSMRRTGPAYAALTLALAHGNGFGAALLAGAAVHNGPPAKPNEAKKAAAIAKRDIGYEMNVAAHNKMIDAKRAEKKARKQAARRNRN